MPELMKLMEDWNGYVNINDVGKGEGYEQKLTEVVNLLSNAKGLPAHKHEYLLREAITTSDFPYLFGDVLDRQVLAQYKATDSTWKKYVKTSTVPRLYPQIGGYRFAVTGGDQRLDLVAEKGEYLASTRDETRYTLYVYKYGRQFDISWEAMVNDDLDALKDTPMRFAKAALRTEQYAVINQYADDDGTHAAGNLYDKVTAGQINGSVALLTIANLEAALEAMATWLDAGGSPIYNKAKYLVVPPSLAMTARQILTSASKMWIQGATDLAGAPSVPYPTSNVVSQMELELIVEPWLPVCDATNGLTAWYLFADPGDIAALEAGYLRGHERPEICMKASDKVTVGGGAINPMSGDFATDNVFYRVRHCFGVCELDWRATYAGGLVS
uniref:Putative capsid protein n=1 Tax=viral metagenome TaxID=1070528 RepID=A0A6M3IFD3_9ZZZZ